MKKVSGGIQSLCIAGKCHGHGYWCDHGIYSFLSSEGGKQDHFHRSKKRGRACTNYEGMSVLQK